MKELLEACHKFISQISPSGDERYYDIDPQDLKEFCDAVEAAQQLLAPDSPYVCLHCGAHISSEHLPWCKSLPQNGGR